MTEPLTREQINRIKLEFDGQQGAYTGDRIFGLAETALHYEARSREAGELLVEAQNRLREVEGLLPDVDEALGKYGMSVTTTGGPPMGSDEKKKAFEDARLALRRVRDTLARCL